MRLHQYWHRLPPPHEVAGWVEGFRTGNRDFTHRLYDEAAAIRFIAEHYGSREVDAFRSCTLPAMQADFFRLCLMDAVGGLYLDADQQPLAPLASLVEQAPHALMPRWFAIVGTGVLMFRKPGNLFIRACLRLAADNLATRRFDSVLMTAGPGVFNAVRILLDPEALAECANFVEPVWNELGWSELTRLARETTEVSDELVAAYRQITLLDVGVVGEWIGSQPAAYKSTDAYWHNWKGPIYRDPPKRPTWAQRWLRHLSR